MPIENLRIKKLGAEVKISNLNKISAICCQNGKGIMVMSLSSLMLTIWTFWPLYMKNHGVKNQYLG